MTGEGN